MCCIVGTMRPIDRRGAVGGDCTADGRTRGGSGGMSGRDGAEPEDEEAGLGSDGFESMGVMVCGGGTAALPDREAGASAAPASRRRVVNVAERFSNLPTLPARRAPAEHAVDNSECFGAATTVAGSHFGVAKAPTARAREASQASVTTTADILSNNKPVAEHTHMDVLNKLTGLTADARADSEARREKPWLSANRMLATADAEHSGKVLTPASLMSPPRSRSLREPGTPGSASSSYGEEGGDGRSRPTSASFGSSSGSASDDGSDGSSDSDAAAAGVFGRDGRSAEVAISKHGHKASEDFCLGIRWFMRNNKLVVGSFSGWSVADKMGVKHGDILRGVDGVEVLHMTADAHGNHPARQLLKGRYGSKCALHLMRVDAGQVKSMLNRPGGGPSQAPAQGEKLMLHDVHVEIPRLIDSTK